MLDCEQSLSFPRVAILRYARGERELFASFPNLHNINSSSRRGFQEQKPTTRSPILSAHCLGYKAGLVGSNIASVLFYLEAATRIHGKLACTQVNCPWILPTYVNEVPYARAKDIDFLSA